MTTLGEVSSPVLRTVWLEQRDRSIMSRKKGSFNHPAALAAALDQGALVLRGESEAAVRFSATAMAVRALG